MTVPDEERIAQIANDIDAVRDDALTELPFELFDRQSNKTTRLVANSGGNSPVIGRNRWFDFKFQEPVILAKVKITTTGYSDNREFEVKWENDKGEINTDSVRPNDNSLTVTVNDVCTSISFKPPTAGLTKGAILSISATGIERKNIAKAIDTVGDLERAKTEANALASKLTARAMSKVELARLSDARKAEVEKSIAKAKDDLSRTKKSVDDLLRTKTELTAGVASAELTLSELQRRMEEAKSGTVLLTDNAAELDKLNTQKRAELKGLKENINLFPSEISGFVNQGTSNINQYLLLVIAPMVIMCVMVVQLLRGAVELTTIYSAQPDVNIILLVVSRLPYVTISLSIIAASYKISRAFIEEIFKVNRQRLNLTKLSIIAKDVSSASSHGLGMNEDQIFRLRTELKMELLREHLKDYLSKDAVIRLPNSPFSIMRGFGRETKTVEKEMPEETATSA